MDVATKDIKGYSKYENVEGSISTQDHFLTKFMIEWVKMRAGAESRFAGSRWGPFISSWMLTLSLILYYAISWPSALP